jgi:hypothetical protein
LLLIFWLPLLLFFLGLPYLLMRLVCDVLRVHGTPFRIATYVLLAWGLWAYCQLPREQTGWGQYSAHYGDPEVAPPAPPTR